MNNVFSSVLELILAFFYSVQVSIAGTVLYSILCAILWYLAERLRTAIHMLHLADDSAKVSRLVELSNYLSVVRGNC